MGRGVPLNPIGYAPVNTDYYVLIDLCFYSLFSPCGFMRQIKQVTALHWSGFIHRMRREALSVDRCLPACTCVSITAVNLRHDEDKHIELV